ncbi:MAG TPA: glycosyltransferase family 4 protein [Anaerolineae bacterium]|nr:glycosyltransferase family 4 protein [Anaerolineae bacterium]
MESAPILQTTYPLRTRSRSYPRTSAPPTAYPAREQWIGFIGKLSLEKGVHCLVAAAPEIIERAPQARFLLIGDGVVREHLVRMRDALGAGDLDLAAEAMRRAAESSPESYAEWVADYWAGLDLDAYREQALAADLEHRIVFTGYQAAPQVAQLISHTDLLVIPSLIKEAFPLVSVEALSSGLMFVAPYVGGLAPILDRVAAEIGELGPLARIAYEPERLIPELIDRVSRLLNYTADDARRLELSQLCRSFAIKHFDWANIVSRIESVYVSALYGHMQ